MTKAFYTFIDQGEVKVTVSISCKDRDGADAEYDIEIIEMVGVPVPNGELDWSQLSGKDQLKINQMAEEFAQEHACEAYQCYAEGMADQAHDEWKDRMMELGE